MTTTQDEWYHVRIVCDGSNVKVWRWQDGQLPNLVFNYTTSYTTTYRMLFQKRRQRTVGGVSTWYNWSLGWSVLNEESGTGSGTLLKTYIGGMAEIAGSTPATGTYSYYATDNLGSPRAVYDGSKALAAVFDFTPYGQAYAAHDTVGITHRYTGHDWDATANLYFAPYRFYNPQLARWMTRDPLGMVDGPNVYTYIVANPIAFADPLGLIGIKPCSGANQNTCIVNCLLLGQYFDDCFIVEIPLLGPYLVCVCSKCPRDIIWS